MAEKRKKKVKSGALGKGQAERARQALNKRGKSAGGAAAVLAQIKKSRKKKKS